MGTATSKSRRTIEEFDPDRVAPLPGQPRKRFAGIAELAESIEEIGQTTPGIVTLVAADGDGRYSAKGEYDARLVDGERRLRACKIAGVPFRAEVRDCLGEAETFALSLTANFQHQEHDPLEISDALLRLTEAGKTQAQIARMVGKTSCWVSQYLSLQKLHQLVRKRMLADGDEDPELSMASALELARLPEVMQLKLMEKACTANKYELRRMIENQYRKNGAPALASSRKTLGGLAGQCEQFSERIGPYLDLPGVDFAQVIAAADRTEREGAAESLRDLAENLIGLAEGIERWVERDKQSRLQAARAGKSND